MQLARVHIATKLTLAFPDSSSSSLEQSQQEQQRSVPLDVIGGLDRELASIEQIVRHALHESELFTRVGLKPPRGILLFGPPGTGKTMIARRVSAASGAHFEYIGGSDLTSKYVGQAESKV